MAGEPTITIIGRLGADPEIRIINDEGTSVANCSVAVTPRHRVNGEWTDKETMWYRVALWRNVDDFVDTARKGALVIATGRFSTRSYEAKDGTSKTELVVDADGIGIIPATAKQKAAVTDEVPW